MNSSHTTWWRVVACGGKAFLLPCHLACDPHPPVHSQMYILPLEWPPCLWHNFLHCLVYQLGYQLCVGWTFCLVCSLVALFSLTAGPQAVQAPGPEQVLVLRKQSNISWTNGCNLCSIRSFCRRIRRPSGALRAACTQFTRVSWSSFLGVPLNYHCYT